MADEYDAAPPSPPLHGAPATALGPRLHLLALAFAMAGAAFGLAGAFVQELLAGGGVLLLAVVAAPIIEELVKPVGVYVYLARWPRVALGRVHTVVLCALAGLVFGLIESTVYVRLYVSDPSSEFVAFRYSVPVAMHTIASGVAGAGLDRGLIDWAGGRGSVPLRTRVSFLAAMLIHSAYNATIIVLSVAGRLDVE